MDLINSIFELALKIPISILAGAGAIFVCALAGFFILLHLSKRMNPFKRALRFYERGYLNKALMLSALELDKNPDNRKALELKADIEVKRNLDEAALNDYYRLVGFKRTGDGVNVMEIKKKMLLPLHRNEHLLELYTVCSEILKSEKNDPDALYYMAVLYAGQMYYREAARLLERLLVHSPGMAAARFLYSAILCQEKDFSKALSEIKQARSLDDRELYRIIYAGALYFSGKFGDAASVLRSVSHTTGAVNSQKKSYFIRRLNAFCLYRTGEYEKAASSFKSLYNEARRWRAQAGSSGKKEAAGPSGISVYDETGRVKMREQALPREAGAAESTVLGDYYRLKEVALEERKLGMLKTPPSLNRLLDIEGLSYETQAALDYGFAVMKSGNFSEAIDFFKKIRRGHPEVIGLNRLVALVEKEGRKVGVAGTPAGGNMENSASAEGIGHQLQVRASRKKTSFSLPQYVNEWEKNAIKPYQLLIISDLVSRKQLSPVMLFGGKKK